MSYTIEQKMLNNQTNNEPMLPVKKRDHRGEKNPHWGCKMSQRSKDLISTKQRQRWATLRQIVDKKTVTEDRVREIVKETIADYIKNNATPIDNNKPINIHL